MATLSSFFILVVGDDGAFLLPPGGATPLFAPNGEEGLLLETIKAARKTNLVLLADCVAQDFKRETLPPVSFFDRRKILSRRLEQAFPKTGLKQALPQKNGQALFLGLDPENRIGFWLDKIRAAGMPTPSISLLPAESAAMASFLSGNAAEEWKILLSHHRTGGYRQLVTRGDELILTRLTPLLPAVAHPSAVAETLAQELEATRAYLARMGLLDETPLHLAAILPSALHASFAAQKTGFATRLVFSPREAAARLSLKLPSGNDDISGEAIHALWFQSRPRRITRLMQADERAAQRTRTIRKWGKRAAFFCGVLALLSVLYQLFALWGATRENARLGGELTRLEERFEQTRVSLASEAAPLDRLRKAVERRRFFAQRAEGPEALFNRLLTALPADVRAMSFDWTQKETRIDLLLTGEETTEKVREIARQRLTQAFDNLRLVLREALPEYDISIARYPFPTLPQETITNKEAAPMPPPVATFVFRKETA